MSKLRDFQVVTAFLEQPKPLNQALFATGEPVRLWIRARRLEAPFQKLLITLRDAATVQNQHGHVTHVDGVCEVTEAVDLTQLARNTLDQRWVLQVVQHALSRVGDTQGWHSESLEAHIAALSTSSLPLEYSFDDLTIRDKTSHATYTPWFRSQPGLFEIGVKISVAPRERRDVIVVHSAEPVFLEDDFPLSALKIDNGNLIILDKKKSVLAVVDWLAMATSCR